MILLNHMLKKIIILAVIVAIILAIAVVLAINLPAQQKSKNSPINLSGLENTSVNTGTSSENLTESAWQNANNPSQSSPLEQSEVPKEAIKVFITEQGITPASFEANAGEEVMLSVSSGDQWTHIFKFKSDALKDVAVGVGPKETRAISFLAPEKGEYEYYCDVPGHIERGEKGVMIVK